MYFHYKCVHKYDIYNGEKLKLKTYKKIVLSTFLFKDKNVSLNVEKINCCFCVALYMPDKKDLRMVCYFR